jgi:hypothetical protein
LEDESIINVIFYIVAFFVFFGVLGVNIKALFVGFLGLIVSFAFMIGSASSKYVEVRPVRVLRLE